MKKVLITLIGVAILAGAAFAINAILQRQAAQAEGIVETLRLERGDLTVTVASDGVVQANQSAFLTWKTSGSVGELQVQVGDRVRQGQVLAEIDPASLPAGVILAQVEMVQAQNALDDLLSSESMAAEALKAVDEAQKALEDARDPQKLQAQALQAVADAQATVDDADRLLKIVEKTAPQSAINQAYANLVMAETVVNRTQEDIDRIEKKLNRPESNYSFWESKSTYRKMLKNLEIKLARDQVQYQEALEKYNLLQLPPDPLEVLEAQTALDVARAELENAQREYERVKDGYSQGEIALLEAKLEDARREYERWKDGPDPVDILAAEARVTAAQALLDTVQITAPFDSVITAVFTQSGDQVAPGSQAFRLDDASRLLVDVKVSEIDINKIRLGQPVQLTFDAVRPSILPQRDQNAENDGFVYQGQVIEVLSVGEEIEGLTFYPIKVEILDSDELVKPGITAQASFITDKLGDVLLAPSRAIRFQDGHQIVYVMKDGIPTATPITIGASSPQFTQIVDGDVSEGDQIAILSSRQ